MRQSLTATDLNGIASDLTQQVALLQDRQIFLTGGTGFFGKWVLHSFLALRQDFHLNASLTVLSREPDRFLASYPEFKGQDGLDFLSGDVRTFDFSGCQTFDFVIHGATAASATLEKENPAEMESVITEGTRHVLDLALHSSVSRFLFISSGAVYGPQPPTLSHIPETYEGSPTTAYGRGKKIAEQLCLEASAGRFDCIIARPFAFVGPYLPLDAHFAIGNFIRDCLENRPIVIQSDGTPLRSYLYTADLTEWLWTILLRGENARPYNVGSSEAISIFDLAHLVRRCAGTKNEIIVQGKKIEGALPVRYVPSVNRAEKELGLSQRYSLTDAIRRTIAWHRTQ